MNIGKKILIFIILSVGLLPTDIFLYAQENNQISIAKKLLSANKIDSLKIKLNEIFKDTIHYNDSQKANVYFIFAGSLEKQNKEDVALIYYLKAEEISRDIKNEEMIADIQFAKFSLLKSQKNLDKITKSELELYIKQLESYLRQYYQYALEENDKKRLIKAYMSYGVLNFTDVNYKKALENFDKAITVCKEINDTLSLAKNNNNKGLIISLYYNNQDSARIFYKKALKFYELLDDKEKIFDAKSNIGLSFANEKKYKEALSWLHQADAILKINMQNNSLTNLYALMYDSYKNLKDYKNANAYLEKFLEYKNKIDLIEQNIAMLSITAKYEALKKEKENIQLKAEKKNQKIILLGVLGTFIAFLIVGILMYKNLQRKRELAEKEKELGYQKVVSLVKEQELKSIDAMIEGQEKERKRIAEDLHDNLGSKLAVLKLQFDGFIDKADAKNDIKQVALLTKTGNLLDETYNAVRSMSHVESAGVMVKQGLVESVKLLAENISMANKTEIQVIDFGLETHINHTIEIGVFRVIQELVTNIVKHSNANKATIDITLFDDVLGVIVADDGIGFNANGKVNFNGIGLGTVKNRVERLNGHLTVDSKQGKGTTIIIEVPVINRL